MNRLCLGTVQQGMRYGIDGIEMPSDESSIDLFKHCIDKGIDKIDTAAAYGRSEQLLGQLFQREPSYIEKVDIITKLHPKTVYATDYEEVKCVIERELKTSLRKLNLDRVDGLLIHESSAIYNEELLRALNSLKDGESVLNVGISVYNPEEALQAVESQYIDYIQIPYNVLDRRLDKTDFFENAYKNNKTVFARSVFLQGLLLKELNSIPEHLRFAEDKIRIFREIIGSVAPEEVCIEYVNSHPGIDFLVLGVQSKEEFDRDNEIINAKCNIRDIIEEVNEKLVDIDIQIISPNMWRKN